MVSNQPLISVAAHEGEIRGLLDLDMCAPADVCSNFLVRLSSAFINPIGNHYVAMQNAYRCEILGMIVCCMLGAVGGVVVFFVGRDRRKR